MKIFWIIIGSICLMLGSIGIVVPFLPTVPFYLATLFCYAKGSRKLHDWFIHTNLYKKHLESFKMDKTMTLSAKISIMCSVTFLMTIGFLLMKNTIAGRTILLIIWICHMYYFIFRIKTLKKEQ